MAYNKDIDYQEKINKAVKNSDYASAANYEKSRNEKIEKENLSYEKTNNYSMPNGVDGSTYNKMQSSFNKSSEVTNADTISKKALSKVGSLTSKNSIISNSIWNAINTEFEIPSAVTKADAYLSEQLEKIQSGKTSYSDQIRDMMSQIQNREKFSYDVDKDSLFQQALSSAMNSGKQAMQDTIGQASALTGGYSSTYATTAGNQAYNAFIEDAYNNLPQYYQMAMEAYQMEGDEMYRQLGMLNDADATEYNRDVTAYDATYQHRNQMYNEAYTQYRDNKSDAFAMANLELSEHGQQVSDAYNYYNAASNYADTLYSREYNKWADEVNQAMQYAQMLNSEYWNQTNFDESVRQYEKNYAQTEDHFTRNQEFQASESQKQRDWQSSEAEKDRNFTASENAKNRAVKSSSGLGGGDGFELTTSQLNAAKKAFDDAGGGENGFQAAVDTLAALGINIDESNASVLSNALANGSTTNTNISGKIGTVSGFKTNKNDNFDISVDGTSYRVENRGKVEDADTVKELNKMGAKNGSAFTYNGDLYVKYAGGYYKTGATNILWNETGGYQSALKALQ